MDDFKYAVIEKVRLMPLLWDPENDDYKNKDQRQQAWDKLESEIQAPKQGVSVKQTWESLNRAFNSALSRRKIKKSGNGQSNAKPWKFETSMSFLKSVKEKRITTSNVEDDDSQCDETSTGSGILDQAIEESGIRDTDDDDEEIQATSISFKPNSKKPISKSTVSKRKATNDAHDDGRSALYKVMTQRMEEKHKSPRLKFFELIMPQVDAMTDDCFLDFKMSVLTCLKRSRESDAEANSLNEPRSPASWPMSSRTSTPSSASSHPTISYPVHGAVLPPTCDASQQSFYPFPN